MTSDSTSTQHHYERSDHPKLKSDRKKKSIASFDRRSRAVGDLGDPNHRSSTQPKTTAAQRGPKTTAPQSLRFGGYVGGGAP